MTSRNQLKLLNHFLFQAIWFEFAKIGVCFGILFKTESNRDGFSWHEEEETAGSVQETWHSCKLEELRNGRQTLLAFQGSYHSTLFFK